MSVRINIEFGHEATVRSEPTIEGFTHDWMIFLRGCNDAAIHRYIEKVVFYLHESFANPKREIKEPPYMIKESGYAGFSVPIDIYLKNNHKPRKINFKYELDLQAFGPPIFKIQKDKYIFKNPSQEFQHKLLRGGGSLINEESKNSAISSVSAEKRSSRKRSITDNKTDNNKQLDETSEQRKPKKLREEKSYRNETKIQTNLNRDMLTDLYNKIMTLEDNEKLEKIVKMMSKSGYLEITTEHFEFDLCEVDSDTIKNLQRFFDIL